MTSTYRPAMRSLLVLLCSLVVILGLPVSWGAAGEAPLPEAAGSTATAPTTAPIAVRVAYIPIDGEIEPGRAAYFTKKLKEAQDQGMTHVVVHLTTPGGRLDSAMEMLQAALNVMKNKPRLIAFVDSHSLSAGSLIAYGHDEILLTSTSIIGDIGVIMQKGDGTIEYAPEKMETVVRALLRNTAQNRGWDEARLQKMTARNQELYRFDLPAAGADTVAALGSDTAAVVAAGSATRSIYVIEDDLPKFLADHPTVKTEQKTMILGKDRLISYTAQEAVGQGMATALVSDLDGVYARLGVTKAAVTDLSPTSAEKTAWWLAGFAPLLIAAAMLFVFLEFKMPMGGLWLVLAGVAGVLFFVCQFYLDLATYLEVVLILLGLGLIITELFFFPFGGLIAGIGGLSLVSGLVLAFVKTGTQFEFSSEGWGEQMVSGAGQASLSLIIVVAGFTMLLLSLHKIAVRVGLADAAAIDGSSAGQVEASARGQVGQRAVAATPLRPSGQVRIDDRLVDASAQHGEFIDAGETVVIVAAQFGSLVVRRDDAATGGTT